MSSSEISVEYDTNSGYVRLEMPPDVAAALADEFSLSKDGGWRALSKDIGRELEVAEGVTS